MDMGRPSMYKCLVVRDAVRAEPGRLWSSWTSLMLNISMESDHLIHGTIELLRDGQELLGVAYSTLTKTPPNWEMMIQLDSKDHHVRSGFWSLT